MPSDLAEVSFDVAGPRVFPALFRLYQQTVIAPDRLLGLADPNPLPREHARVVLASGGGFLHELPDWTGESLRDTRCTIAWGPGWLLGYHLVVTHAPSVQAVVARLLGWEEGRAYRTERSLPRHSAVGTLSWTNPARALELFSSLDRLAVNPELCVRARVGAQAVRPRGLGEALLRAGYRTLPPDTWILGQIFEIEGVNGIPIDPPVVNEASTRIQQRLGAVKIGHVRERIHRQDGIRIDVAWGLWLMPAAHAHRRADEEPALPRSRHEGPEPVRTDSPRP